MLEPVSVLGNSDGDGGAGDDDGPYKGEIMWQLLFNVVLNGAA